MAQWQYRSITEHFSIDPSIRWNKLGYEGWELIGILSAGNNRFIAFFKRQAKEGEIIIEPDKADFPEHDVLLDELVFNALDVSTRIKNSLATIGYSKQTGTIRELLKVNAKDLLLLPGFGVTCLVQLIKTLKTLGIKVPDTWAKGVKV